MTPATSTRRKRGTSPTARSLAHLRAQGYLAEVVEKRLPKVFITKDLFGFIDILAIKDGVTYAVQTTSSTNIAARRAKILASENLARVRAAGWRVVVHGWAKQGPRGACKVWMLRELEIDPAEAT